MNKMKALRFLGGLAIAASSFAAYAFPATITSGNYTANLTGTGTGTASGILNSIYFGAEALSSAPDGSFSNPTTSSGSLSAQFQAGAGLIFDRVIFGGITGGAIFNSGANAASASYGWTVNGGTFVGGTTHGGPSSPAFNRTWDITGPNTGTSYFYLGTWEQTKVFDFNNPEPGSGYYSVGASSFSIDWLEVVKVYGGAGGGIAPHAINFSFTYLDAPVAPVPEPETYAMMLAGLCLLGFAARRRKQKEAAAA